MAKEHSTIVTETMEDSEKEQDKPKALKSPHAESKKPVAVILHSMGTFSQ